MTCVSGKLNYASPQAAHAVITKLGKRDGANKRQALTWAKGKMKAYRCPMCGGWHIGNSPFAGKEVRA